MEMDDVSAIIRKGWEALCKEKGPRSAEAGAMDKAAEYLVDNANALGLRPPNVGERARAVGLGQYLRSLGLSEKQQADALGNSFDKDAVQKRLEAGLVAALHDPVPLVARPPDRVPTPLEVLEIYRGVLQELRSGPSPIEPTIDRRPLPAGAYPRLELGPFPDFLMSDAPWRDL
eukprot:13347108-Alexandrium_andersonii.AAC.1